MTLYYNIVTSINCHCKAFLLFTQTPLQSLTLSQTSESTLRNNTTITVSGHYTLFDFGVSVEVETGDNIITSSGIKWFRDCVYELNGGVHLFGN